MKDIKGYEGLYAITSCGKVWSYRKKRFLKPIDAKDGYLKINLYKDHHLRTFQIHRLVAEAYLPNPDGLPEVNHKDEVKTHNYINNLEWCSRSYNVRYSMGKPIYCVELDKVFGSMAEAAAAMGVHQNSISACVRGISKTCCGYHWQYVE